MGCSDASDNDQKEAIEGQEVKKAEIENPEKWRVYQNDRFNYSIDLPRDWSTGEKPINDDGISFFDEGNNIDISMYGSNLIEGASKPYKNADKPNYQSEEVDLESGEKAVLIKGLEDDLVHYEMVVVKDGVEYHFVARTPEKFFNENKETLDKIVNSFKIDENTNTNNNQSNEEAVITKEIVLNLENDFFDRAIQKTDKDYLVLNFGTKMKLHDYIAEITSEEVAEDIVNTYYTEDKGGLYLVPKDEPVKLIIDEPVDLSEVNANTFQAVQYGENQLYGKYKLTITYTNKDGQWIMKDRDLEQL